MAEEKRKRRPAVNPDELPCPICGELDFEWGLSVTDSPNGRIYSRAEGVVWGGGEELFTRKCVVCNNVQFFTERP